MPEATATYGDLDQLDDGRWQLRFTRVLSHPVEKVWRAITEPDHLAHLPRRAGACDGRTGRCQGGDGGLERRAPPLCRELRPRGGDDRSA
jgi:hypothetical protein